MVDTGSSLLAVSHVGDIVEFSCQSTSLASTVRKLHTSKDDKFRVDDFAWSDTKETLLVGYLGARDGKDFTRPAHQVILYRREETPVRPPFSLPSRRRTSSADAHDLLLPQAGTALVPTKLDERPHVAGGVTAIATLPGTGRLRFVTGGEDKKCVVLILPALRSLPRADRVAPCSQAVPLDEVARDAGHQDGQHPLGALVDDHERLNDRAPGLGRLGQQGQARASPSLSLSLSRVALLHGRSLVARSACRCSPTTSTAWRRPGRCCSTARS